MEPEQKKQSLSIFGVGPFYAFPVMLSSVCPFFLPADPMWQMSGAIRGAAVLSGLILLLYGLQMWFRAVFVSKMIRHIRNNQLMTDGVYAVVRNPVYSGILSGSTGIVLASGNTLFLFLPVLYYLYLDILLRHTEEVWLLKLYGEPYRNYCQTVPRSIPRLKKLF